MRKILELFLWRWSALRSALCAALSAPCLVADIALLETLKVLGNTLFVSLLNYSLGAPGIVKVSMEAKDLKHLAVLLTFEVECVSLSLGMEGLALFHKRLATEGTRG